MMQALKAMVHRVQDDPQLASQAVRLASQGSEQVHQVLDALHVVTTPSQVIETPATLEHVVATQLKVELEQLVVHIVVAFAEGAIPVDAASATTTRRPVRVRSLRIFASSKVSAGRVRGLSAASVRAMVEAHIAMAARGTAGLKAVDVGVSTAIRARTP